MKTKIKKNKKQPKNGPIVYYIPIPSDNSDLMECLKTLQRIDAFKNYKAGNLSDEKWGKLYTRLLQPLIANVDQNAL